MRLFPLRFGDHRSKNEIKGAGILVDRERNSKKQEEEEEEEGEYLYIVEAEPE